MTLLRSFNHGQLQGSAGVTHLPVALADPFWFCAAVVSTHASTPAHKLWPAMVSPTGSAPLHDVSQELVDLAKQLPNVPLPLQVTLGRLDNNSLTIQDSEVSGHHAVMRWDSTEKCWQVTFTGLLAAC